MMKRYINMPLKKALALLFIALLLAGTTGCLGEDESAVKLTSEERWYKGKSVVLVTSTRSGIKLGETVTTDDGYGGKCIKAFDKDGRVTSVYWQYPDGTDEKKEFNPAVEDPLPGLLPGMRLIDRELATSTPTLQPTVRPITPYESGIGDDAHETVITPEQPAQGDLPSHVEGGV
jgi:hypothetical protein